MKRKPRSILISLDRGLTYTNNDAIGTTATSEGPLANEDGLSRGSLTVRMKSTLFACSKAPDRFTRYRVRIFLAYRV